ncbi:hypothetical protein QJS66_04015 [Kocuria rhizophila]|nr:hypothetical protein QJS66_04015 [Kocuria rhizophila]
MTYGLGKKTVHLTEEEKRQSPTRTTPTRTPGLPVGHRCPERRRHCGGGQPEKNDYYWVTVSLGHRLTSSPDVRGAPEVRAGVPAVVRGQRASALDVPR